MILVSVVGFVLPPILINLTLTFGDRVVAGISSYVVVVLVPRGCVGGGIRGEVTDFAGLLWEAHVINFLNEGGSGYRLLAHIAYLQFLSRTTSVGGEGGV